MVEPHSPGSLHYRFEDKGRYALSVLFYDLPQRVYVVRVPASVETAVG